MDISERTPLLTIFNLEVGFKQGSQWVPIVKRVSFDIYPGESFALVGESGSGKSITALSVLRLLPHQVRITGGKVLFSGKNLFSLPECAMGVIRGKRIGMVSQEPMSALNPVMTIGQQIGEVVGLHRGYRGNPLRQRVLELCEQVGLPYPVRQLSSYPHQLSGGMRQRAMIALALAGEPDILIADEPTTALDVTIQAQIVELLRHLRKETGMALWLITHDLGVVSELCDRIAVMQNGEIIEQNSRAFFEKPKHPYSQSLLRIMPRLDACFNKAHSYTHSDPLLEVSHLKVYYPIRRGLLQRTVDFVRAVDGVSFSLARGETLALVGESGCGKTTLGKAIVDLVERFSGHITFDKTEITSLKGRKHRKQCTAIQFVFQDPYASLNPRLTIGETIEEGLYMYRKELRTVERRERVELLLQSVGLSPDMRLRYPHEFSGGQRQRIAIARALVTEPQLIICDEPTSALDMPVQSQILKLFRMLQIERGLSYLFITHDLAVVAELADRVAVLHQGQVVEIGETRQVLFQPQHTYTQRLLSAIPKLRLKKNVL